MNQLRVLPSLCHLYLNLLDKPSKSLYPNTYRRCLMKQKVVTIIMAIAATTTTMAVMIMVMQRAIWMHMALAMHGVIDLIISISEQAFNYSTLVPHLTSNISCLYQKGCFLFTAFLMSLLFPLIVEEFVMLLLNSFLIQASFT